MTIPLFGRSGMQNLGRRLRPSSDRQLPVPSALNAEILTLQYAPIIPLRRRFVNSRKKLKKKLVKKEGLCYNGV